jgi:hypothetical protein
MLNVEKKTSKLVPNSSWKTEKTDKSNYDGLSDDGMDFASNDDDNVGPRRITPEETKIRVHATIQTPAKARARQDLTRFPVTLGGLSMAKRACRQQMARIVNEIDEITADPSLATDETRAEPYMPVHMFRERMPEIVRIIEPPASDVHEFDTD